MNKLQILLLITTLIFICVDSLSYCQAPVPVYNNLGGSFVLKQVAVYHRHGDRSPLVILPHERDENGVEWRCDQHIFYGTNVSTNGDVGINYVTYDDLNNIWAQGRSAWKGNCYTGQLTKEGASMTYQLGSALRDLYINKLQFLPDIYDPSVMYFRATNVARAQQSLFSVLQGLYPAAKRNNLAFIPFHVVADSYETLLPNSAMCPRISQLQRIAQKQPDWVQMTKKIAPVIDKLVYMTDTEQTSLNNPNSAVQWMDILNARMCHKMPLPCNKTTCITEDDASIISEASVFMVNNMFDVNKSGSGYEAAKLVAGPMLNELLEFMEKMVNGVSNTPRYLHFSAHDTTILPLMAAFQSKMDDYPPYASTFIVELYQSLNDNEYYVRAMYNNKVLTIPDCWKTLCPYSTFKNMIQEHYTIKNVAMECNV